MAAGLLRKRVITIEWGFEVGEEVVGSGKGSSGGGGRVYGVVVVLVKMAYTERLPAFGGGKEGGGSSFFGCDGGGC